MRTLSNVPLIREPPIQSVLRPASEPVVAAGESDAVLIRRLRDGDQTALDPLFRRHAPSLVALAARITGSVEDGKDVVQDVFVRLPVTAKGFREQGEAAAWLRGVTSKSALNARRRTSRRREFAESALDTLRDRADIASALDLSNAVEALPVPLRDVFLLKVVAGYSHQEVAELLDIKSGTSEVRLFRAIRQLRTLLADGA